MAPGQPLLSGAQSGRAACGGKSPYVLLVGLFRVWRYLIVCRKRIFDTNQVPVRRHFVIGETTNCGGESGRKTKNLDQAGFSDNKKPQHFCWGLILAEREGFEPSIRY